MSSDAITLYQEWLDRMSTAILAGNTDVIADCVSLPYLRQHTDLRVVIETRRDLEREYKTLSKSLQSQGVNHFILLASSADYLSDDYIEGRHIAHVLRNTTIVAPSFEVRCVLRRTPTSWKQTEVQSSFSASNWPLSITASSTEQKTASNPKADVRREAAQPLALYQRFINALTLANVADDFDGYCRLLSFPYSYHSENFDAVANEPDDIRPFFDNLTKLLRDNNVEEFLRIAKHAEFISSDMICGYHTTQFLNSGKAALDPIKSRMILRRVGTRWFLYSVTNAIQSDVHIFKHPVVSNDLVTQLEIQERTKKWPTSN